MNSWSANWQSSSANPTLPAELRLSGHDLDHRLLLTPRDVVVYDAEAHACIIDGLRMHKGKRFVYGHNDMASLRLQLKHATELAEQQNGGVLVITEGVFGMKGDLGKLDEIVAMKKDFNFRLLVDDAHGFGTMGPHGRGTAAHFGVVDGVDVLFNTFAKSMAASEPSSAVPAAYQLLRYNMRSQLYAKSLPMPMVIGALKRLDLIRKHPEYQEKLWEITRALQGGLKENGFEIGVTQSPVTPVYMKGGIPEATNLIVDLREKHNLFCSVVVYPVIPKRNHPAPDPDGSPHARRREVHDRGVQSHPQQARKRLLPRQTDADESRRRIFGALNRPVP